MYIVYTVYKHLSRPKKKFYKIQGITFPFSFSNFDTL